MNARNLVHRAAAAQGGVGVVLVSVALVALTSWPWALLAAGGAMLVDVALRSLRPTVRR